MNMKGDEESLQQKNKKKVRCWTMKNNGRKKKKVLKRPNIYQRVATKEKE